MSLEKGSKTAILVVESLPDGFDLSKAVDIWSREDFSLRVVDVGVASEISEIEERRGAIGGRSYDNISSELIGEVGTAFQRSGDVLVVGVKRGGPFVVGLHSVFPDRKLSEQNKSLTAATLFSNMDLAAATTTAERKALRTLQEQSEAGILGVTRENTFNFTIGKDPTRQSLVGATVTPILVTHSPEDAIAATLSSRNIPARIRDARMRNRQRMQ
jgi:hypothetical protein